MNQFIDLSAKDGFTFPAWVAEPSGAPRGAIVVVPEIFGVNSHIRSVADGFAAEGYLTVAPSVFARVEAGVELSYGDEDLQRGFKLMQSVEALPAPGVMQDLQAAVDYAASKSDGGKVGIVGYCWGGLLTWRASALLSGLSAAVPYYGGGMTTPDESKHQPKVPVMAHFGDNDEYIPLDTIKTFEQAHPEVEVHLYSAKHGFNCDERGAYKPEAAGTARERTLYFFNKHLR